MANGYKISKYEYRNTKQKNTLNCQTAKL